MEVRIAARVGLVGVGLAATAAGVIASRRCGEPRGHDDALCDRILRQPSLELRDCVPLRLPEPAAFVVTDHAGSLQGAVYGGSLEPIVPPTQLGFRPYPNDDSSTRYLIWQPFTAIDLDDDGIDEIGIKDGNATRAYAVMAVRGHSLAISEFHDGNRNAGTSLRFGIWRDIHAHDALTVMP